MINLAVITGAKSHDVIGFQKLFSNLEGVHSYIQHMDDFAASPQSVRDSYDALLFYFMPLDGPTDEGLPGYCGKPKSALENLGETKQGIVVLHHALLAYPQWPLWGKVTGLADRSLSAYSHDETMNIEVVDSAHPITQGISDWSLVDETYLMADADSDNQLLLKTAHPQNAKTVAWVRNYRDSRVLCLQLGHDAQAWEDANFKKVLTQGIVWSCSRD